MHMRRMQHQMQLSAVFERKILICITTACKTVVSHPGVYCTRLPCMPITAAERLRAASAVVCCLQERV